MLQIFDLVSRTYSLEGMWVEFPLNKYKNSLNQVISMVKAVFMDFSFRWKFYNFIYRKSYIPALIEYSLITIIPDVEKYIRI